MTADEPLPDIDSIADAVDDVYFAECSAEVMLERLAEEERLAADCTDVPVSANFQTPAMNVGPVSCAMATVADPPQSCLGRTEGGLCKLISKGTQRLLPKVAFCCCHLTPPFIL